MFDLEELTRLTSRAHELLRRLKNLVAEEHVSPPSKSIGEVADMVGRTPDALRRAEKADRIPAAPVNEKTGRRLGYAPEAVQDILEHFQVVPHRPEGEVPRVLAVHNLKGGVAKTTLSVHVAQYAAVRGLRTLLLDCDSQASATRLMGHVPDIDFAAPEDTVEAYFRGEQDDLRYAVRETYLPRLDLIPSSLVVFYAEFILNSRARAGDVEEPFQLLNRGLEPLRDSYDLIVIDAPPALGMMGINVMFAATSLLVPVTPNMLDFASTMQYLNMLQEAAKQLHGRGVGEVGYDWFRAVITKQRSARAGMEDSGQARSQDDMLQMCKEFFGPYLLLNPMLYSTEIESASDRGQSLYDLTEAIGSRRTHRRAMQSMDKVCGEVFDLLTHDWQTQRRKRI
jgi:chromosome partitioning protein